MSDWDFGFTAVDDIPETGTQTTETVVNTVSNVTNEFKEEVMSKLAQIEARILDMDNSGMVNEHRALVESDVANKLVAVEELILPLLYNLKKNPEKEYIHWPNRVAIIDKQIEKIQAVTRYFERLS
jgi:hypothetical protein